MLGYEKDIPAGKFRLIEPNFQIGDQLINGVNKKRTILERSIG